MNYITGKQSLLQQILQNTKAQTDAIQQDQMEELESLIANRDDLMRQVDILDQQVPMARQDLPENEMTSFRHLLSEIIEIDKANQILMQKEFEHVKGELRKIRLAKQQEQNYTNQYGAYREEGIFFDTKEYRG